MKRSRKPFKAVKAKARRQFATTAQFDRMIVEWFRDHPDIKDVDVHELAGQLGISPEELEGHIYRLFSLAVQPEKVQAVLAYNKYDAVPLNQLPDLAVVEMLERMAHAGHCTIQCVLDGRGKNLFEISDCEFTDFCQAVKLMGWRIDCPKPEVCIARKGNVEFTLVHI